MKAHPRLGSTASKGWAAAGLALFATGTAIRINNALEYPINLGFDAPENWRYVHQLIHNWALPAPDADWATSHPPFFYYLSAVVGRITGFHTADPVAIYIRLLSSGITADYLSARTVEPRLPLMWDCTPASTSARRGDSRAGLQLLSTGRSCRRPDDEKQKENVG